MIIGVPKEIKADEYRVAVLPVGAELLTKDSHTVLIEKGAGLGSGYDDQSYTAAGAQIVESADEIFRCAEMIVKVKEPQGGEIAKLKDGQIVFWYFHFAASQTYTPSCIGGVFGFAAKISCYFVLFCAAIAASRPLRASVSFG